MEIRSRCQSFHSFPPTHHANAHITPLMMEAADTGWSVDRRGDVRNWAFDVPVPRRAIIIPADNVLHRWNRVRRRHFQQGNARRKERGGVRLDQGGVRSVSRIHRR